MWLESLGVFFPDIGFGAGTEGQINSQLPICESGSEQYLGSDLVEDVLSKLDDETEEMIINFIDDVLLTAWDIIED